MQLKNFILKNKNGMTLVELIAASVVTGIVMLGVASMDISLRNAFQGVSRNSIVAARASGVMHHISKNIAETTGDSQDLGVSTQTSSPASLWIRKDPITTTGTPADYTDDGWFVYQYDSGTSSLLYCSTSAKNVACVTTIQSFPNIVSFEPTFINSSTNYDFDVSVKLTSRYDTATAADDLSNPQYSVSSIFNLPVAGSTIPST